MEKKKKKKNFSFQGYFKKSAPSTSKEEKGNQDDDVGGDHMIERDDSEGEFSSHVRTQFCKKPLGLVAYYRCTEGKHATLGDSSGCHRAASIRNYREQGADSPWMFKLKNKQLVELENERGERAKANFCLRLSGKSKCYVRVEPDHCLELLGGNYCTDERAIKIKNEIAKRLGGQNGGKDGGESENAEGFTFEMWIGIKEDKFAFEEERKKKQKKKGERKKKRKKKYICLMQKGKEETYQWSVLLVIDTDECHFLIDFKNEKFQFDSFPLEHLKTKKIDGYYWSHVSITFNLTIDLIYIILTGEGSYFMQTCKNLYAIFYSSVFYPTNFFTDSAMALPLYLGAKPHTLFDDSDGSDAMEGEDNPLAKEMNKEKRRSSKVGRSHKGSSDFVSFLVTEIRLFALSRSADLVVKESKAVLDCAWLEGPPNGGDPNSMRKHSRGGKLSSDEGDDIKNRCSELNNELEMMKERFHRFSGEVNGGSAAAPPAQEDFFKFDSEEEQDDSAKDAFFSKPGRKASPYGSAPPSEDFFGKGRSDVKREKADQPPVKKSHVKKHSHAEKSHWERPPQLNAKRKDESAFYFNFSDEGGEASQEDHAGAAKKPSWEGEAQKPSWEEGHAERSPYEADDAGKLPLSVDRKHSSEGEKSPMKKYLSKIVEGAKEDDPDAASDLNRADVNLLLNELKEKFESEFVNIMIDRLGSKFHLKRKDKQKIVSTLRSSGMGEKDHAEAGDIRERYLSLVKTKEERQKSKMHEEIKEELKKVKEKSTAERNLSSYIKDNQLLNEHYIKKYSCAGEEVSDQESEEGPPQGAWPYGGELPGADEQEGAPLSDCSSVRQSSRSSDGSHSIVNLQYQDGSNIFAGGGNLGSGEELPAQMDPSRDAFSRAGERAEHEEKKSDVSDFTFMKRSSSGRKGRSDHGSPDDRKWRSGREGRRSGDGRDGGPTLQGDDRPSPESALRVLPSNETDLLPEEGHHRKSVSALLPSEEQPNRRDRHNQINEAIKTGKLYYHFICPLTPYELFLLRRFHKKGISEELKEFRNKKYLSCEKLFMSTGGICRTPLNVAYIRYKIAMMKSMLRSSRRCIQEKKFKKGLKICIKNGEYIKNFVSSYCVLRRRALSGDSSPSFPPSPPSSARFPEEQQQQRQQRQEPPYQYADFCLNVDHAYITMDELKNILKTNVRNVIICKVFILMKEYKRYKYIENSSLILVLQSVLCRVVTSYTLLRKILKKFILLLFLRGCLSCVESLCTFLFLMYPKERTHPLFAKVFSLCRNSFLAYSSCYKSNKYAMINNYHFNFEQCVEFFSPEWGYYIYTTSNFNIFSSSVKFNGFLKRAVDFATRRGEGQLERQAICDVGSSADSPDDSPADIPADIPEGITEGIPADIPEGIPEGGPACGDPTQLPEDAPPSEPTKESKLATVDACTDLDRSNKKEPKRNDLYIYLTNYEKKKRSYYIIDDNMRRIEFSRKETNHNLETFLQMGNPTETSTEQSKRDQLDRLMSKVNRDVYLNSSGSSCMNAAFFGHCPHCKHAFNSFSRSCKVCQRYVHVCYYLLIHCTYKYHCELCDATYSEKCLEKFSKGFTCFYCGLFFIRK
ncbi:unnamed protein product [Plasmodium vivax]|uniref:(malaria parasite P. vivax) hypothetical protein n=1 Tax=Plasmodium vivax TaxID=5855 RepID=A0A8S4HBA0_PLAVI|nr:unnamed protein product [Plasmodium vivax]